MKQANIHTKIHLHYTLHILILEIIVKTQKRKMIEKKKLIISIQIVD